MDASSEMEDLSRNEKERRRALLRTAGEETLGWGGVGGVRRARGSDVGDVGFLAEGAGGEPENFPASLRADADAAAAPFFPAAAAAAPALPAASIADAASSPEEPFPDAAAFAFPPPSRLRPLVRSFAVRSPPAFTASAVRLSSASFAVPAARIARPVLLSAKSAAAIVFQSIFCSRTRRFSTFWKDARGI